MNEYNNEPYSSIMPQADNYKIAKLGKRVILRHIMYGAGLQTAKLFIVDENVLHAGWVFGIIKNKQ